MVFPPKWNALNRQWSNQWWEFQHLSLQQTVPEDRGYIKREPNVWFSVESLSRNVPLFHRNVHIFMFYRLKEKVKRLNQSIWVFTTLTQKCLCSLSHNILYWGNIWSQKCKMHSKGFYEEKPYSVDFANKCKICVRFIVFGGGFYQENLFSPNHLDSEMV